MNEQGEVSLDEVSEQENQEAEVNYRRFRRFKLIIKSYKVKS